MKIKQGIYCWTNIHNNKRYIGQSVNIPKRKAEHIRKNLNEGHDTIISRAFKKYGEESFEFLILEEVLDIHLLNERELYWMNFYKTTDQRYGYNELLPGEIPSSIGEKNNRAILTEEEVLSIRTRIHIKKEDTLEVFQSYKEKISFDTFEKVFRGDTWTHIDTSMIENVKVDRKGKPKAKLNKKDVLDIRTRSNLGESVSDIYKDYDHIVTRKTVKRIVNRETWVGIEPVSTISEA